MPFEPIENNTFDPANFSLEENQFLIDHLGEPLEAATAKGVPPGVGAGGLKALDIVYRFGRRCDQSGDPFVGFEALKEVCRVFLREHAVMSEQARQGVAPKFPSRYEWDTFGKGHLGGVGSDAGRMRSYFDEQGNRHYFAVKLLTNTERPLPQWLAQKQTKKAAEHRELVDDQEHGVVTCPICKYSQNYEPGSRSKRAMARTRMGKHLKTAKREPDLHRQLYTYVFGS